MMMMMIRQYLVCRKPELQGQVTTNVTVYQTSNDCMNSRNVVNR